MLDYRVLQGIDTPKIPTLYPTPLELEYIHEPRLYIWSTDKAPAILLPVSHENMLFSPAIIEISLSLDNVHGQ